MTDGAEGASYEAGAGTPEPVGASAEQWAPDQSVQQPAASGTAEHPEVMVGAAFAGGLVAALILKRLAS